MTADTRAIDVRADFARSLARYRARLILASAIRYGAVSVVAAIGLAVTLIPVTSAERTAIAGSVILVVAATAGAAMLAWLRAPGLREIARVIDGALRSSNCLVTAVECVNASDPVADLVVREANRRLAAVSPAEIVPIELPRRFPALVAIVAAAVVAAVIATKRPPQDSDRAARAAGSPASTSPAPSAPPPGQRAGDASGRAAGPTASASVANVGAQGRDAATPSAEATGIAPVGADRNSSASPLDPSLSASRSTAPQAGAARGRTNESAQATGSLGAGSRGGRRGAGAAEGAAGEGGRSSGVLARSGRGAGGVSGDGATLVAPRDRPSSLRSTLPSAAAYQSAWSQAQAAIARDRIPGDLKQIVKDYFTAIRPPQP